MKEFAPLAVQQLVNDDFVELQLDFKAASACALQVEKQMVLGEKSGTIWVVFSCGEDGGVRVFEFT